MMDDAPDWTLSLEIIAIVVTMAFVPLIPVAAWKYQQWRKARREQTALDSDGDGDGQRSRSNS